VVAVRRKPWRFEDGLDRAKSRFAGILSDLNLDTPKGAEPVTTTFIDGGEPVQGQQHGLEHVRLSRLMNTRSARFIAEVMATKGQRQITPLPSMIGSTPRTDGRRLLRDREAAGEEDGWFNSAEFEENMSTHYGR